MKRYVHSMGAIMLLGCCMPALASYYSSPPPERDNPSSVYVAGGYTVATGDAANFVDNGWNVGGGVQWRLPPGPISLRLDFQYSRNGATDRLLSEGAAANRTQINHGWSGLLSNDLDVIFNVPLSRGISAYAMAGGGGAIRRISLTQTVGSGGPYCNDWAGFCNPGAHPGDVLVDSKTTGRWQWNAGVGVSFSLGGGDAFFVEARYVEVQTPVPTAFVPIRVGLLMH